MSILDCRPLLNVSDVERSLAFWCDILGFGVLFRWEHEGRLAFANIRSGAAELMLNSPSEVDQPGPGSGPLQSYSDAVLSFRVLDVHELCRELTAKGWSTRAPERQDYGVDEMLVRDPDGYELAFTSPAGTGA
jgi:uncharacterized glyoxalase superfamily protein PhnB